MSTTSEIDRDRTPTHWVQIGFYTTSIVFNLCLIAQLLTVGVAYFNDPSWWNIHVWLVRGYGGLSLILWGWSSLAPFSRKIRHLAASLPVLLCQHSSQNASPSRGVPSSDWIFAPLCFFNPCTQHIAHFITHQPSE
jgi:hypothetical protein